MPIRTTLAIRAVGVMVILLVAASLAYWQLNEAPRPHRVGLLSSGSQTQQ